MNFEITITLIQLISIILIVIILYMGVSILLPHWSYRINKPYKWENEVRLKSISPELKKLEQSYDDKVRFYSFWMQIERLKSENISGAFAELGVYRGETAKFIHQMDPNRKLYLFDTFDGFREEDLKLENSTDKKYNISNFADTALETVEDYVNGNENVELIAGYFPESAKEIKEEQYAFVHLDADLYKPTLAGLQFFYPKLAKGGVIIIHDYNHTWDGVRKAVKEFGESTSIVIAEIADMQGSIMLIRS